MIEFITLGFGIWFALYFLAFIAMGFWISNYELIGISAVFLVVASIIGWYFFQFGLLYWFIASPGTTIAAVIAYIGIGCLYTVFRVWPKFLDRNENNIIRAYNTHNERREREHKLEQQHSRLPTVAEFKPTSFVEYRNSDNFRWAAWNNKSLISNSILMWVWDAIWDIIESPIRWLYENVYEIVARTLNKITVEKTDKFYAKTLKDGD